MSNYIEIYATIASVMPAERDFKGDYTQRLLLTNVTTRNRTIQVNAQVILYVRFDASMPITFSVGNPITAMGIYNPAAGNISHLPSMTFAHAPTGYVRYAGKIFR
jgi:hypothetical protein